MKKIWIPAVAAVIAAATFIILAVGKKKNKKGTSQEIEA